MAHDRQSSVGKRQIVQLLNRPWIQLINVNPSRGSYTTLMWMVCHPCQANPTIPIPIGSAHQPSIPPLHPLHFRRGHGNLRAQFCSVLFCSVCSVLFCSVVSSVHRFHLYFILLTYHSTSMDSGWLTCAPLSTSSCLQSRHVGKIRHHMYPYSIQSSFGGS